MTPTIPTWKKRLAARLRELRERSGFTQVKVHETLGKGFSVTYMKDLENENQPDEDWNPTIERLQRLMNLYGYTLLDLFSATAEPPDYKGDAHDQLEYILTRADPGDRDAILKAIRAFHEQVIRQRKG